MNCLHCGDQVCIRDERVEGVIHKNGRYSCRNRKPGETPTVATVEPWAEKQLLITAQVKVPPGESSVRSGRSRHKYEEYE